LISSAEIGLIGGTGLEALIGGKEVRVGTQYGLPPKIKIGSVEGRSVAFLPRHGPSHNTPPHRVNYRANIWALKALGITRVISTNAVGAINPQYNPGDLVVPLDMIDVTKQRALTFYDDEPVTHVDVSEPYCPEVRSTLIRHSGKTKVWTDAVMAVTEGPRFETPAEIRFLSKGGCDVVGMTAAPEAFLAREAEICYAPICFISNMAAGLQKRLTSREVFELAERVGPVLNGVIKGAIRDLPDKRGCGCGQALRDAQAR